jgi:hypothetical protein
VQLVPWWQAASAAWACAGKGRYDHSSAIIPLLILCRLRGRVQLPLLALPPRMPNLRLALLHVSLRCARVRCVGWLSSSCCAWLAASAKKPAAGPPGLVKQGSSVGAAGAGAGASTAGGPEGYQTLKGIGAIAAAPSGGAGAAAEVKEQVLNCCTKLPLGLF